MTTNRILVVLGLAGGLVLTAACSSQSVPAPRAEAAAPALGQAVTLYTYAPGPDAEGLVRRDALPVAAGQSLETALNRLAAALSYSDYFHTAYGDTTGIRFQVEQTAAIETPGRTLHVAVVDMVDPGAYGPRVYFQGSAGGRMTLLLLAATFMQPHLEPPLLAGLVVLHNGALLPAMDHLDLSGLLTPDLAAPAVHQALPEAPAHDP